MKDRITLEFDEQAHRYTLVTEETSIVGSAYTQTRDLPSVSSIIRDLSMADLHTVPPEVLRQAGEFGRRIHAMTERHDRDGWLDEFWDLPAEELMHLGAWTRFSDDHGFVPWAIEQRVYHPRLLYAGTIDRIGVLQDFNGREHHVVLDIKTSEPHDWHGVQLAAYRNAAIHQGMADSLTETYAVYLDDAGRYRLRQYDPEVHWPTFLRERERTRHLPVPPSAEEQQS